jgi:hypothetical protein
MLSARGLSGRPLSIHPKRSVIFSHAFAGRDPSQNRGFRPKQESCKLAGVEARWLHAAPFQFRRMGPVRAHRSPTVGARSPGAEGFRTEAAQMKKLIIPAFVLTVVQ